MIRTSLCAAAFGAALFAAAPTAEAGPDEYIGEIMTVGFNFCPRGTLEADGRLLAISQHSALFSLFGTYYGGDGRTTFALPDLRGRTVIGAGQGPGLSNRVLGQKGGAETSSPGAGNNRNERAGEVSGGSSGTNMQPFLVLKQCVVVQGIYPSRS